MVKTCCAAKPMTFKISAPKAKRVSLAGSFNGWDISSHVAKKDLKGNWATKVNLKPGSYEYKFFVDGQWVNDPSCKSCVWNSFGTKNCTVEIK